jgi:hypothetical protein
MSFARLSNNGEPCTLKGVSTVLGGVCANLPQKRGKAALSYSTSVTLLDEFLRYVAYGTVYPIRNNYFGKPEDFALYAKYLSESELLQSRVTKTLDFPALSDMIADDFYTGGRTIPETVDGLGAFAAQSFISWRNQVYEMFGKIGEFEADSENGGGE